jgi:hypothetical protein
MHQNGISDYDSGVSLDPPALALVWSTGILLTSSWAQVFILPLELFDLGSEQNTSRIYPDWSQHSIVSVVTRCGLDDSGIKSWWGEIFHTCPDCLWGPPTTHSYTMGTGSFPGVKLPRHGDHPPPSSAKVNPLTPNGHYSGCTALLTSRRCILNIYSVLNILNMLHNLHFSLFKMLFIS